MLGASGVGGIAGYPAVDLGTNWGSYYMFRVETSNNGSAPETGDPIDPAAGDVWGVADLSGRRGILVRKGMVLKVMVSLGVSGGGQNSVAHGDALYVNGTFSAPDATTMARRLAKPANGTMLARALEGYTNTDTANQVIVPIKVLWLVTPT